MYTVHVSTTPLHLMSKNGTPLFTQQHALEMLKRLALHVQLAKHSTQAQS